MNKCLVKHALFNPRYLPIRQIGEMCLTIQHMIKLCNCSVSWTHSLSSITHALSLISDRLWHWLDATYSPPPNYVGNVLHGNVLILKILSSVHTWKTLSHSWNRDTPPPTHTSMAGDCYAHPHKNIIWLYTFICQIIWHIQYISSILQYNMPAIYTHLVPYICILLQENTCTTLQHIFAIFWNIL